MKTSEKIDQIAQALLKLQAELKPVVKNAQNPFFKSSYADLDALWEAARPLLGKNGLSVTQLGGFTPHDQPTMVTMLIHTSGQWIQGEMPLSAKANDPQALGSAQSYARRYGLAAIIGLTTADDDDGEKAVSRGGIIDSKLHPTEQFNDFGKPVSIRSDLNQMFKFGKFNGKAFSECPPNEVEGYFQWLRNQAQKENKPLGAVAQDTMAAWKAYRES